MEKLKCPTCGCQAFYFKDPDDEYETYEFECQDGIICFNEDQEPEAQIPINDDTEVFCNKCSWHEKFKKVDIEFKDD